MVRMWDYIPTPCDLWEQKRRPDIASLHRIISEFNIRQFSYQQDVLRAFLGIQSHLSNNFLGGFNYGLPDMFFDIALWWKSDTSTFDQSKILRRKTHDVSPSTADYLPSWSWMGWQSEMLFPEDGEFEAGFKKNGFLQPVTRWYAMHSRRTPIAQRRLIGSDWYRYKRMAQEDSSFLPCNWALDQSLTSKGKAYTIWTSQYHYPVPVPSPTKPIEPTEQLQYISADTSRAFFTAKIINKRPIYCEGNLPLGHGIELRSMSGEFAGGLDFELLSDMEVMTEGERVELVAVVKGWTHDGIRDENGGWTKSSCYFVLCINWENGVAKRRGVGKVLADVWERNQEPVNLILG